MNSPDHSTKGTPLGYRHEASVCPPTACGCWVSETLSSPLRGAFHLSLTVLVRYRWPTVLSLGGWSPQLPTGFLVSRGTQAYDPQTMRASGTGLSPSPEHASQQLPLRTCLSRLMTAAYNPTFRLPRTGLGSSRFARHYSGNLV